MKFPKLLASAAGLLITCAAHAAAPAAAATAPAGSTGLCKDGSFTTAAEKKGACHGHKGVQDWYATAATTANKTATTTPVVAAPAAGMAMRPATAAVDTSKPAAAISSGTKKSQAMPTQAAAGGGAGLVWVNTSSKVYHCQADKWYGKTKAGEYLSEADAKSKGFHAEHGQACGS